LKRQSIIRTTRALSPSRLPPVASNKACSFVAPAPEWPSPQTKFRVFARQSHGQNRSPASRDSTTTPTCLRSALAPRHLTISRRSCAPGSRLTSTAADTPHALQKFLRWKEEINEQKRITRGSGSGYRQRYRQRSRAPGERPRAYRLRKLC